MIERLLEQRVKQISKEFPVVALIGPRQSGKTTLAQYAFPNHRYISLEDLDTREKAQHDPRSFLNDYPTSAGIILDEIQYAPHLLSYIQTIVDREKINGFFVVSGSQNFLVNQAISQTLAGRIGILTLLPLSLAELDNAQLLPDSIEEVVYKGFYPRLYAQDVSTERLYSSYIQTYLERDVRQIKNILDLALFKRFISLCAGRIGQVVNYASLGNDCGIDEKTVRSWLGLLEACYIIFLIHPYYKNFGKRLTKAPKLYFVDTGLACSLLRLTSADMLIDHNMRGPLIESCLIADLLKQQYNREKLSGLYFWRDHTGHEVDCLVDEAWLTAIEIKSSKTISTSFFKELNYLKELADLPTKSLYLAYTGSEDKTWSYGETLSWRSFGTLLQTIYDNKPPH